MFAGHVGVALGASKAAPRVNVGWLVFAAMLADFLLGIFSALGLEHFSPAPDFADQHYFLFDFPYSHSLLALVVWGGSVGVARVAVLSPGLRADLAGCSAGCAVPFSVGRHGARRRSTPCWRQFVQVRAGIVAPHADRTGDRDTSGHRGYFDLLEAPRRHPPEPHGGSRAGCACHRGDFDPNSDDRAAPTPSVDC